MQIEAEIKVMCLQAKELQSLLATPEARRKVWNRFCFEPSEKAWPS